jgi:hypothetical protein
MLIYVGDDLQTRLNWFLKIQQANNAVKKKLAEINEVITMLDAQHDNQSIEYSAIPWLLRLFFFKPSYPWTIEFEGKTFDVPWLKSDRHQVETKIKRLETMLKAFDDKNISMIELSEDDMKLIKY